MTIDPLWAKQFADEWIEAWNAHDLDRIFSHYTDDFEMTSPLIIQGGFDPSGTLKGKEAVRPYWQRGLDAVPPLKFELVDVLIGVESIAIYFRRASGKLGVEVLFFNPARQVIKGIAHHTV